MARRKRMPDWKARQAIQLLHSKDRTIVCLGLHLLWQDHRIVGRNYGAALYKGIRAARSTHAFPWPRDQDYTHTDIGKLWAVCHLNAIGVY